MRLIAARADDVPLPGSVTRRRVEALAQRAVSNGLTPGIAIGVANPATGAFVCAAGMRDVARSLPMTGRTAFRIGSVTKQFTAAALALLWHEGALSLDDRVAAYVPVAARLPAISLKQLLQHTSGLPKMNSSTHNPLRPLPLEAKIARVSPTDVSEPGVCYRYSNLNYFLLGAVIERVTGKPFTDFIAKRILEPVGMTATGFEPGATVAQGYTGRPRSFVPAAAWHADWLGSAACMVSTAGDMVRWSVALPGLLSRDGLELVFRASPQSRHVRYAASWIAGERNGLPFLWHAGEVGGYHAVNALLPTLSSAVCVLLNTDRLNGPAVRPLFLAQQIVDMLSLARRAPVPANVIAYAERLLQQFAAGRLERAGWGEPLRSRLTSDAVAALELARFGPVQRLVPVSCADEDCGAVYTFNVQYADCFRMLRILLGPGQTLHDVYVGY